MGDSPVGRSETRYLWGFFPDPDPDLRLVGAAGVRASQLIQTETCCSKIWTATTNNLCRVGDGTGAKENIKVVFVCVCVCVNGGVSFPRGH